MRKISRLQAKIQTKPRVQSPARKASATKVAPAADSLRGWADSARKSRAKS